MKVIAVIGLILAGVAVINGGWLPLLFPIGAGIYYIVDSDKNGAAIEGFFSLCFLAMVAFFAVELFRIIF